MVASVLQFKQPEKKKPKQKPIESTGVIRKPGSNKLYLELYPNGVREQISSRMDDTPENEQILIGWIKKQRKKIDEGTFCFADAFPTASKKKKMFHAMLEGKVFRDDPSKLMFVAYTEDWMDRSFDNYSLTNAEDYKGIINYWLKPFFKHLSFDDITAITLKEFIKKLKHKKGKRKGQWLSVSRRDKILGVFSDIWADAVEEYMWERPNPTMFLKKFLKEDRKKRPEKEKAQVLRIDDWFKIEDTIFPYYKPMIGLMIRTGMSQSEISGLKKSAIRDGYLHIEYAIVRNREKDQLKSKYRKRRLPLTKEMKKCLDQAAYLSDSEFFFRNTKGSIIRPNHFSEGPWSIALKRAGVAYVKPYTMRHSFAAWSLALRMDPNRLANLMGHGTKKMVYETYGSYVEGLETDTDKIRAYFGNDFK